MDVGKSRIKNPGGPSLLEYETGETFTELAKLAAVEAKAEFRSEGVHEGAHSRPNGIRPGCPHCSSMLFTE